MSTWRARVAAAPAAQALTPRSPSSRISSGTSSWARTRQRIGAPPLSA
jgi:hypothetical protein